MAITTNVTSQRQDGPTEVWPSNLLSQDGFQGRFGKEGTNTKPSPTAPPLKTTICEDGHPMVAPGDMYRMDELHPGRREPQFPGLHNLHDTVITRTRDPPPLRDVQADPTQRRRAALWDQVSQAVRAALQEIPHGAHVAVVSNSGPKAGTLADQLEEAPPGAMIPGATVGLLFVAEFRDERASGLHPDWRQIACPIRAAEGRLLAGLRLLPAVVAERPDLTFTVTNLTYPTIINKYRDIVHNAYKQGLLQHGSVLNSWKPTNLGCFFHPGGLWYEEYDIFKRSFACDGDLYGWDEAVLYTRDPVAVIAPSVPPAEKPRRRFNYWYEGTALRDVQWLQLDDKGRLCGERVPVTKRADVVRWDEHGIPGGPLD
ncbi:hypothetical protein PG994_008543 [Apiospora phragmitis]|uniref:Uncharacterized protein n=1 Tax=Apiospora phragmitis TaxID=2905665 RepID=A0ABR1UGS0_9PEZI